MRLTNSSRDDIVNDIMRDVPRIDYQKQFEEMVKQTALNLLPKKVKELWLDNSTRHYISVSGMWTHGFGHIDVVGDSDAVKAALDKDEMKRLAALDKEQDDKLHDLRTELRGVVNSCTTVGALRKKLPEFEAYFPSEKETLNVPATQVVASLVKAGWPAKKGEMK